MPTEIAKLLPLLLDYGLSGEDSLALASHVVLLFFSLAIDIDSPKELLSLYSLDKISQLVEELYVLRQQEVVADDTRK